MKLIDADELFKSFESEENPEDSLWTLYGIKRKIEDAPRQEPCEDATLRDIFCMGCEYKEQEPNTWDLDDAREDFMYDVYNTLDFLPTNDEANEIIDSFDRVTSSIKQEPFEDAISRQAVLALAKEECETAIIPYKRFIKGVNALPPVNPQPKTGHCKDCKHFEYDRVAKVDGVPLMVAHEICSKWGDGCKTWENGYCFMFEPKKSEEV